LLFAGGLGALGSLFAHPETALTVWRHYDAVWYLNIAADGYPAHAHDPSEVGSFGDATASRRCIPWPSVASRSRCTSRCWRRRCCSRRWRWCRAGRVPPPRHRRRRREPGRVALLLLVTTPAAFFLVAPYGAGLLLLLVAGSLLAALADAGRSPVCWVPSACSTSSTPVSWLRPSLSTTCRRAAGHCVQFAPTPCGSSRRQLPVWRRGRGTLWASFGDPLRFLHAEAAWTGT